MKKYITQIRVLIFIEIIAAAAATVALAITPYLIKILFDSISSNVSINIEILISLYVICIGMNLFLVYIETLFSWKSSIKFENSLKKDFFRSIANYSYKKFKSKDIGEYISLQGNEITQLEMDYLRPLIDMIKSINIFIIYGIMLFIFIDWRIAIIILGLSIISTAIAPNITSKNLSNRRKIYLDNMGEYISKVQDLLEGFKLIQSKTRENINREQENILNKTSISRLYYGKLKTLAGIINGGFRYSLNIIAFAMLAYLLYENDITVGTAVATLGYIECFIIPIQSLIYDINTICSTKSIKKKVVDFLNDNNEEGKIKLKKEFKQSIEFKNVTIKYDTFKLNSFSYNFQKGKKYAIIGPSGSGKSTIINSIMKFTNIFTGEILIDNENISTLDISEQIYCISQEEHTYRSNFKNNITVFSSYKLANIDFIKNIIGEKMFNSLVSKENCQLLSGGEKQVLSIIRMILAESPIWIMDEIFSATDINLTKELRNLLFSKKDKTMIMVTHRLTDQLKDFDEILIMENGSLIKSGTYDELCKTNEYIKLSYNN